MDHEDWKQILAEQSDLSDAEPGTYSVDEILSQFWLDYTDEDAEKPEKDRKSASAPSEPAQRQPFDFDIDLDVGMKETTARPQSEPAPAAEPKPAEQTGEKAAAEAGKRKKQKTKPGKKTEPAKEPAAESATESGTESAAELAAVPVTDAENEEKPASRWSTRKKKQKQKVWEEFPDSPKTEAEPAEDTVDYTALFHMFAEEPAEGNRPTLSVPASEQPEFTVDLFGEALQSGTQTPEAEKPAEEEPKETAAEEPLFAESTDGDLDFRNILREFMLGDQHPIYADMPGIGKKASPADELPETEKAEAEYQPAPRPKREYRVEEDFPIDLSGLMDLPTAGKTAAPEPEVEAAPEEQKKPVPPDKPKETPAAAKTAGSLLNVLRGVGVRPVGNRKKALNEPKTYASFEDYIPENTPENAEAPKAPDGDGLTGELPASGAAEQTDAAEESFPASPAVSAEMPGEPSEEEDEEILYSGDFPSFGQWILNELMTLWIRINGIGNRESTFTMEDDSEELGKEVNVANASRYYGSQVTMLRMRFEIGLVMLAILAYITLGFPVSGMLKTAKVAAAMCLGLQLTVMLLCLDIVTNAAVNLTRRKFGADALAVLACVISSFDALAVAVGGFGTPHIPLCLFSSLALMSVLFASLLSARGLRKSIRVPAIGKRVYSVTAEEGVRGGADLTLLKSVRPTAGFVRRSEEAPPDETLFSRSALLQLLAAIVLTLLTALVRRAPGDMLYILSAILSCAVPVTALLAFSLPFFIGSQRIFSSGAAVAGWSGIHDIGCSRNLIVTDRDLFPEDTVSIETVRVFADDSAERVIGYAGTMIAASGSGLGPCFAELMERNGCRMRQVEDFQWLSGGGLQGRIEGQTVLCGSSDLMQLMNVKIPYRLVDRTTVLLAIDGVLYGIFKINYTGLPEIRTALQELIASNRHPIFAIRDFNITPDMLHDVFDVATDGYDFPPFGERFRISEAKPSETSKISAVICREGLGPLTHLADTGRSMYVAIRLNLMVTAATALLGMLSVFVKLIGTGVLSAWLPFVLMLLDALIVALISLFMRF